MAMRRLAIFDIDATLTLTQAVHNACFVRALVEAEVPAAPPAEPRR